MEFSYSPYEILRLPLQADSKEIRRAYKDLIREFTPEHAPEEFIKIRKAYEQLMGGEEEEVMEEFPIYKRPFSQFEQLKKEEVRQADPSPKPLSDIFESPYNTDFEVKKLLKATK